MWRALGWCFSRGCHCGCSSCRGSMSIRKWSTATVILDMCTAPSHTRCFHLRWSASFTLNFMMTPARPALTSISNSMVIPDIHLPIRKSNLPSPLLQRLQQPARSFSARRLSLKTSTHQLLSLSLNMHPVETSLRLFSFSQLLFPFGLLRLFSPKTIVVTV